jgi:hypothetical protein
MCLACAVAEGKTVAQKVGEFNYDGGSSQQAVYGSEQNSQY